jgi:hypothetical protein
MLDKNNSAREHRRFMTPKKSRRKSISNELYERIIPTRQPFKEATKEAIKQPRTTLPSRVRPAKKTPPASRHGSSEALKRPKSPLV